MKLSVLYKHSSDTVQAASQYHPADHGDYGRADHLEALMRDVWFDSLPLSADL
jgi:hypothetical protein